MLLQESQMAFNELEYVTVQSAMNTMAADGAKMAHKVRL